MKKIYCHGKHTEVYALVDDEDYDILKGHKWYPSGRYLVANFYDPQATGRQKQMLMHRYIVDAKSGVVLDHINGDGLDNRKVNLRICTQAENSYNRNIGSKSESGFKGVNWHRGRWQAKIKVKGKWMYLGRYHDKIKAALAYNKAAIYHFGQFANINNIKEGKE